MKEHSHEIEVSVVGIDLGKNAFHVHGVDGSGHVVLKKQVTRKGLVQLMSQLPRCLVGIEACGGSHDWARRLMAMGHDVRLMGAQFVKPYVKSNKNDFADAEAICEAVRRPNMRFVPVKGMEQQDVQSIHRARSMAVSHRTAQANQIRGLLAEYGLVLPQGMASLGGRLPEILADADNELTPMFRDLLAGLMDEVRHLDERVAGYDGQIRRLAQASDACQRLMTIPGVDALTAIRTAPPRSPLRTCSPAGPGRRWQPCSRRPGKDSRPSSRSLSRARTSPSNRETPRAACCRGPSAPDSPDFLPAAKGQPAAALPPLPGCGRERGAARVSRMPARPAGAAGLADRV